MRKYLYKSVVFHIARYAGLGSGGPEVKPSTSGPMPVRLKELTGKLRWMNWEPVSLTAKVRRGGHVASGKRRCESEAKLE